MMTQTITQTITKPITKPKPKTTAAAKKGVVKQVSPMAKELKRAANAIAMTPKELTLWFSYYPQVSEATQETCLRLIAEYRLNPRADELDLVQFEEGHWQVFITINGWAKLINAHPAFCGIEFSEASELEEGVPMWMGCAIYRTDRIKPIEIKEYFSEMKTEHAVWQQMPRRMLRHRAMQQCARLAFGITVPECKPNANLISHLAGPMQARSMSNPLRAATHSHTVLLKERLAQLSITK
jgi:hypothetical protein